MREEKQKGILEEIQSLDEATKWKVLVVGTVAIMAIVVYLWLGYFNGIIVENSQQTVAVDQSVPVAISPTTQASAPAEQTNLLRNIGNGIVFVFGGIGAGIHNLAGIVEKPHQYDIQPKNN